MKTFTKVAILLTFIPLSDYLARLTQIAAADFASSITLSVYNFAQVSPRTLARSIQEASRIFQQAGIETNWLECGPELNPDPACQQPPSPTHLALRIVLHSEAQSPKPADDLFGGAMPYEAGGVQAAVFFQHVQKFAQGGPASLEQVLGHVMAHETGHLLLWSKSHAPTGIMKASWSREDLRQIARGQLPFTTQQGELMKANLITRLRQEEHLKVAVTPISASQEISIQE